MPRCSFFQVSELINIPECNFTLQLLIETRDAILVELYRKGRRSKMSLSFLNYQTINLCYRPDLFLKDLHIRSLKILRRVGTVKRRGVTKGASLGGN